MAKYIGPPDTVPDPRFKGPPNRIPPHPVLGTINAVPHPVGIGIPASGMSYTSMRKRKRV